MTPEVIRFLSAWHQHFLPFTLSLLFLWLDYNKQIAFWGISASSSWHSLSRVKTEYIPTDGVPVWMPLMVGLLEKCVGFLQDRVRNVSLLESQSGRMWGSTGIISEMLECLSDSPLKNLQYSWRFHGVCPSLWGFSVSNKVVFWEYETFQGVSWSFDACSILYSKVWEYNNIVKILHILNHLFTDILVQMMICFVKFIFVLNFPKTHFDRAIKITTQWMMSKWLGQTSRLLSGITAQATASQDQNPGFDAEV